MCNVFFDNLARSYLVIWWKSICDGCASEDNVVNDHARVEWQVEERNSLRWLANDIMVVLSQI